MTREERRDFLRERAKALFPKGPPIPAKPVTPNLAKWRKRLSEKPKLVYVKPYFSLGVADVASQAKWLKKVAKTNEAVAVKPLKRCKGASALTEISEKLKPGADAPDVWWGRSCHSPDLTDGTR